MGRAQNYKDQKAKAKKEDVNISGLIDTATSVFMEFVRSGERNFILDPPDSNGQTTWVRVKEKTNGWRLGLGLAPSGLYVSARYVDEIPYDCVAFAPSRKFPEHLIASEKFLRIFSEFRSLLKTEFGL